MQGRQIHQLIVCGDHLFPGDEPLKVWRTLNNEKALCLQGVGDLALATVDPDSLDMSDATLSPRIERLYATHEEIGDLVVAQLRRLPDRARLPLPSGHEMLVIHGSPTDPMTQITCDMSDAEINALIGDEPADIILCGGDHVAFSRELDNLRIVGVGSVGEAPIKGTAHAVIIDSYGEHPSVEHLEILLDD